MPTETQCERLMETVDPKLALAITNDIEMRREMRIENIIALNSSQLPNSFQQF